MKRVWCVPKQELRATYLGQLVRHSLVLQKSVVSIIPLQIWCFKMEVFCFFCIYHPGQADRGTGISGYIPHDHVVSDLIHCRTFISRTHVIIKRTRNNKILKDETFGICFFLAHLHLLSVERCLMAFPKTSGILISKLPI